ncbi:MAG TPA: hypothetical protein VN762_11205 [Steroidobacteraceae bacterium]|nr:hypothetical protein [Steroidobacteraceae bacterium]
MKLKSVTRNLSRNLAVGLLASALLAAGGCARGKDDATQAVNSEEASLASVRDDAAKYMPAELQSVESSVTAQKESLAKKDYKVVVANAPAVNSSIDSLKAGVAAKMEENRAAGAEWSTYSTAVPQMVTALQSRIDTLTKSKRMPKNLDATAFGTAKTDLETMKIEWAAASAAHDSGNEIDAVAKAKSAKATGDRLLTQLGMNSAG